MLKGWFWDEFKIGSEFWVCLWFSESLPSLCLSVVLNSASWEKTHHGCQQETNFIILVALVAGVFLEMFCLIQTLWQQCCLCMEHVSWWESVEKLRTVLEVSSSNNICVGVYKTMNIWTWWYFKCKLWNNSENCWSNFVLGGVNVRRITKGFYSLTMNNLLGTRQFLFNVYKINITILWLVNHWIIPSPP